jgi:hypothetical protein
LFSFWASREGNDVPDLKRLSSANPLQHGSLDLKPYSRSRTITFHKYCLIFVENSCNLIATWGDLIAIWGRYEALYVNSATRLPIASFESLITVDLKGTVPSDVEKAIFVSSSGKHPDSLACGS